MEQIEATCKECGNTFQREKKRGRPHTKCEGCRVLGQAVTEFAKAQRKETTVTNDDGMAVVMVQNAEPCKDCGEIFMRPKRKGKPPVRCSFCKEVYELEKTAKVAVSQEQIEQAFKGKPVLLKGTPDSVPRGAEAQCPRPRGCGRIFTSTSACDNHKIFGSDGNIKECKDPASLGMVPIERRGLPVWRKPMDENELARLKGL